jgi:UDP:flavonoid glycosyltransferase YjiC (YdhE family)
VKALVCCVPQAGHFNPIVPLIRALVAAGDDVLVAGGTAVQEPTEASGARFELAGSSVDDWFGRLMARTRGVPGDGLPPHRIAHYFLPRLFAEIGADDMVEGVLAAAERFRPDWVIHDSAGFAGPLIAELVDARSINHLFGPLLEPEVAQLVADAVSPLWRSYGRDAPSFGGMYRDVTIGICPASLIGDEKVPSGELLQMQPAPPPSGPSQPQSPPLVYVTFGTLWANVELLRTVLVALADEPVRVVVTTGQLDPADLPDIPANVRVARFIPQADLLPQCSAVLHHAGAGTMFGALAHGLPQVAVPQAADNFVNAEMLARAEVASMLLPPDVTAEAVRQAVRQVIDDPGYRTRAQRIATEMAAMPSPDEVAVRLRAMAGG